MISADVVLCKKRKQVQPDSKKVGTTVQIVNKNRMHDVEVSNFNILFRIQHR